MVVRRMRVTRSEYSRARDVRKSVVVINEYTEDFVELETNHVSCPRLNCSGILRATHSKVVNIFIVVRMTEHFREDGYKRNRMEVK